MSDATLPSDRARPDGLGTWRDQAACDGTDPDLWFPTGRGFDAAPAIAAAKDICATCPVRPECLEAGLHEPYGVWGGMSEKERRVERRRRVLAGQGTPTQVAGVITNARRQAAAGKLTQAEVDALVARLQGRTA